MAVKSRSDRSNTTGAWLHDGSRNGSDASFSTAPMFTDGNWRAEAGANADGGGDVSSDMPPKSLKLTAKQHEFVQSRLERDHGDADLWAFPELERQARLAEIDEDSGLNWLEVLRRNIHLRHQVNDEECEALLYLELLSTELRWRGVARRIAFNTLSDLRTALSVEARLDWFQRGYFGSGNDSCYPEAWPILRALAARDLAVVRRFFEVNDQPVKRGHRPTVLLYNGLLALVTDNKQLQSDFVGAAGKLKGADASKSMLNVLAGIINGDAPAVVAGLAQVMASFRRLDIFDEDKIICFLAHGLAELALEKNSDLLGKFDCEQGLPWDAAFFEWLRKESPTPVYPELTQKSKLLDKWLNRLEPPSWWEEGD